MTVESTGFRSVWKNPVRATEAEARGDMNTLLDILIDYAPELIPSGLTEHEPIEDVSSDDCGKPVPGAEACNQKSRG